MSATATEQEQKTVPDSAHAPEVTVLARFASIPLISSSLTSINDVLSTNAYTRSPYAQAKELSTTAYKLTEPLQVKLAPLIVRADGYANKAVDAVESRYPYPFKAQPEEVATLVRESRESTTHYVSERVNDVNKAIDERVKTPAINVAHGIDQRFAPIVNYFEGAFSRFNTSEAGPSTPPNAQYQYQRALALSKTLGENLYEYSNEQLKHIQAQSVIAQRASETAHSISTVAASSLATAQTRIHTLSDNMLAELQKLQTSSTELSASLQNTLHSSAAHIQSQLPQIQQSYADLTAAISATVHELSTIITTKDIPVQDKVARVSKQVQDRVQPLLETVKQGVAEVLARSKAAETKGADAPTPTANGNGHAPEHPVALTVVAE